MSKNQIATPKQAQIKIASLLKGIDNSVIASNKHAKIINDNTKQVKTLCIGLLQNISNGLKRSEAAKPTVKPAKSVAKPAKKPAVAKPAKKPVAKPAKAANVVAKPDTTKPLENKPVASTGKPPAVEGRPILKDAIKEILLAGGGAAMPANKIYNEAVAKYGYWSRQSCYNALDKSFTETDKKCYIIKKDSADTEVDSFVDKQLEKSNAVAAAVGNVQ